MTYAGSLCTVSQIVLGMILLAGALLTYFALRGATDGSEDDQGFHRR